jgi:hypothetical protein
VRRRHGRATIPSRFECDGAWAGRRSALDPDVPPPRMTGRFLIPTFPAAPDRGSPPPDCFLLSD